MNPILTSRRETGVELWNRIDACCAAWDPSAHPFHARIAGGKADPRAIFLHASEFEHMAFAVAGLSQRVAGLSAGLDSARDLALAAFDDRERLTLWRRYARALGWGPSMAHLYAEDPLPQTTECALTWSGTAAGGLPVGLIRICAAADVTTRMARSMAVGLRLHYGFAGDPALLFFDRQAKEGENLIRLSRLTLDALADPGDPEELAGLAEEVHRSYWAVADGLADLTERG